MLNTDSFDTLQTWSNHINSSLNLIKNHKFNKLAKVVIISIILWITCFILCFFANQKYAVNHYFYIARIEFIIHIITLFVLFSIYKEAQHELTTKENKVLLYFIVINIWIFIVDILFYIAAYAGDSFLQELSSIQFILYYAPCIMFGLFMVIFLSNIFVKDILLANGFVGRMCILLIISLITYALFLSAIHYAYKIFSFKNILQMLLLFIEFILFDISIVGLIYSKNTSASIFLIGIIILVTGDFFLTYTYISQTTSLFLLGEFLWFLGILFLMFSIINIKEHKHYFFNQWFRSDNTVRSRMGFGIFLTAITGFLCVFIISYILGLINNQVFINIPLIIMFYSIIVVILSIFTAKSLEIPFKKIEKNIKLLTHDINDRNVDNHFPIKEFDFLQTILINSFKFKDEKEKMNKRFGDIAARVAHDLNNPINGTRMILPKIKTIVKDNLELNLLETYIDQIYSIASDVLNYFQENTPNNNLSNNIGLPRFVLLEEIVSSIIQNNKNWQNNIEFVNNYYSWVYLTPIQLYRKITNLLTNAHESLTNQVKRIIITTSTNEKMVILTIEDTGCGIPQEYISEVLCGKSLKPNGHGFGLSSAVEYFNDIDGKLSIKSTPNIGTKITIQIPRVIPNWFTNTIRYTDNTIFAILENDINILSYWQQLFIEIDNKILYFTNIESCISWIQDSDLIHSVLIISYEYYKKLMANDLPQISDLLMIYITYGNTQEYEAQNIIKDTQYKLISHFLLQHIALNYAQN